MLPSDLVAESAGEDGGKRPNPVEHRIRVDCYHHFPEGIELSGALGLDIGFDGPIRIVVQEPEPPTVTRWELVPGTPRHK